MMGRTHATSGACAGAWVALGAEYALPAQALAGVGLGACVWVGAQRALAELTRRRKVNIWAVIGWLLLAGLGWAGVTHELNTPVGPLQRTLVVAGLAACAALCWRAAFWPDLDHQGSTATHAGASLRRSRRPLRQVTGWGVGLLAGAAHEVVHAASCTVWEWTATKADRAAGDRFRGHRGLTHTALAAVVFSAAIGWAASWVLGAYATLSDAEAVRLGVALGASVCVGMLAHDVGDMATKTGVPFFWPIKIHGHRYYPIHILPAGHRITTGKDPWAEQVIRWVCWGLLVVAVAGWIWLLIRQASG